MPPNGTLPVFERNNFFYGLLMDVDRFRKGHAFLDEKRRMLNRLVLGSGVLCGLDVTAAGPTLPGLVLVQPGAAIDPLGREIVVPEARTVDPRQPTDQDGSPSGAPLAAGTVEICLAFTEVTTDLVPVLVPDCDGPGECAPSTIRESYHVIVRAVTGPPASPPAC